MTQEQTADILDIDPKTLRRYFAKELRVGRARATAKVAQTLFQTAVAGSGKESVTAGIFWMKVHGGWKETSRHEHADADGKPLQANGPAVTIFQLPDNGRPGGAG